MKIRKILWSSRLDFQSFILNFKVIHQSFKVRGMRLNRFGYECDAHPFLRDFEPYET